MAALRTGERSVIPIEVMAVDGADPTHRGAIGSFVHRRNDLPERPIIRTGVKQQGPTSENPMHPKPTA
jgi:hypothetical protein